MCEPPPGPESASTADCEGEQICNPEGTFQDPSPCTTGDECPGNGVCGSEGRYEQPECATDSDCDGLRICGSRGIREDPPPCESDEDFPGDGLCNPEGRCEEPECRVDDDCAGDQICSSEGSCADPRPCTFDADCPGEEVCDLNDKCQKPPECNIDGDCAVGEECKAGNCEDGSTPLPTCGQPGFEYAFFLNLKTYKKDDYEPEPFKEITPLKTGLTNSLTSNDVRGTGFYGIQQATAQSTIIHQSFFFPGASDGGLHVKDGRDRQHHYYIDGWETALTRAGQRRTLTW
jgi:hypothetical protein